MRAAVCRAFNAPLSIEEVDLAPPGPGEVRVRLAATAICHSDIHFIEGAWGGALPAVYGHEAAGIVEETGAGVDDLAAGDHVVVTLIRACGTCWHCTRGELVVCEAAFPLDAASPLRDSAGHSLHQGMRTGAFAEQVTVHRSQLARVPADLPLDVASLLACGVITGVGAVVNTAAVPPGASVVVIGAGGVGLNVVQGARIVGAERIVAVDPVPAKRTAATTFGATDTIDPSEGELAGAVRALTGGRGGDFVFVSVGSKAAIEAALPLMRMGGAVVIVGMPASGVTIELDPTSLAAAGQRVIGSRMGSARIAVDIPWLVALYRQGRLRLDELITGRYPLAEIDQAIAEVRRGGALRNVIIF